MVTALDTCGNKITTWGGICRPYRHSSHIEKCYNAELNKQKQKFKDIQIRLFGHFGGFLTCLFCLEFDKPRLYDNIFEELNLWGDLMKNPLLIGNNIFQNFLMCGVLEQTINHYYSSSSKSKIGLINNLIINILVSLFKFINYASNKYLAINPRNSRSMKSSKHCNQEMQYKGY